MRTGVMIVAFTVALAACGGGDGEVLLGTLERDRIELVAEAGEPIIEVGVREGEAVAAGQQLLQLDTAVIDARLQQARQAAVQLERRLAELRAGARREDLARARALADGAAAQLQAQSKEFVRVESLVGQGLLPASALDRQRAARDGAEGQARATREQLAELQHGTRSEVLQQAAAALAQAQGQVAELELSRARMAVAAPRPGVIDALPYKLGERPPAGAPVAILLAAGPPYARVFIPEPRRATIGPGTAATVTIDGSGRSWAAELRYVSSEAAFTPYYALNERDRSRLSYLAEVVLTEPEALALPTGMPVEVRLAATLEAR